MRLPLAAVLKAKLAESMAKATTQGAHHDRDGCCGHDDHNTLKVSANEKLVTALRSAMKDFVDVAVYFTVGVMITAAFNTGLAPGAVWFDSLAQNSTAAPAAMMGLAFILSLCSTSDAFIAATLAKFSWGAKLAFLTFGPMMDVKLLFLYQSVLRKRFIFLLALGIFIAIGITSMILQYFVLQAR